MIMVQICPTLTKQLQCINYIHRTEYKMEIRWQALGLVLVQRKD